MTTSMSISFEVIALAALFVLPVIFVLQTMASNSRTAAWTAPAAPRAARSGAARNGAATGNSDNVVALFPADDTRLTAAA